jgi:hypothetical protein
MPSLIPQQVGTSCQLKSPNLGRVLDPGSGISEAGWLVERQPVNSNNLRSGAKRDAIPTQQPRNLKVARRGD